MSQNNVSKYFGLHIARGLGYFGMPRSAMHGLALLWNQMVKLGHKASGKMKPGKAFERQIWDLLILP